MTVVLFIVIFLLAGILGEWIMGRVDRFLNKYISEEEAGNEFEDTAST